MAPTEPLSEEIGKRVFSAYRKATALEPDNYKAWHSWAMVSVPSFRDSCTSPFVGRVGTQVELVHMVLFDRQARDTALVTVGFCRQFATSSCGQAFGDGAEIAAAV